MGRSIDVHCTYRLGPWLSHWNLEKFISCLYSTIKFIFHRPILMIKPCRNNFQIIISWLVIATDMVMQDRLLLLTLIVIHAKCSEIAVFG